MISVFATDRNLMPVGDPISGWVSLDVTLRFNEPSSGTLTVPLSPALDPVLQPGNRLVVVRDGFVFCAGPIEQSGPQQWAVDGQDSGPGTIDISFADDLALIVAGLAYPNPAEAATAQTADQWTATALAEDVLRDLVNENVGPGALPSRQIPQLVLGANGGAGSTITFSARFEQLGDLLRSAAIAGGGLGFRTTQVGNTIVYNVYEPQNLTGTVRFSPGLGNLRSYTYTPEAPTCTVAIVGGDGEGAARTIVERVNTAAVALWGRLEQFVDQRGATDLAELEQAGDEALANGAETARLSTVTIDTATQRYGTHYSLGDRVSVQLATGVEVADVVRAVHLQATPDSGEYVTALVGSQDASADPMWVAYVRDIARRLGRLEVR